MALTREQFQALRDKGLSVEQIVKFESQRTEKEPSSVVKGLSQILTNTKNQVLTGVGKGALSTIKGLSGIGEKILQTPLKAAGVKFGPETSAQKLQSTAEKKLGLKEGELTTPSNKLQKVGKFAEQVAEFAIPGAKVEKLTAGSKLGTKLLSRAISSGGVATAQSGKVGKETAIAGATEIALPIAGKAVTTITKPVVNVLGRLLSGLGSGISGAPSNVLQLIYKNPETAKKVSKKIIKEGQESVLEDNAKTIMNGISKIKQEARSSYGKELETLSKVDIKPENIAKNTISALKKNKINVSKSGLDLSSSEILDKNIQKRAVSVINDINERTSADGKDIKYLIDKISSSKFKTGLQDPDRLAFNALMNDLSKALKNAVDESTDKLSAINKKFSTDMNLAEGMEKIFGKVNFKNESELNAIAKKLDSLFNQKGLDPKTINNFLTRIGVSPSQFETAEATRAIANRVNTSNTKGLRISEIIQELTSAVVPPKTVQDIAIATGLTEKAIKTIIKNTSPTARAIIIKSLLSNEK